MALASTDIPALALPGLRAEFDIAYRNALDNSPIERIATVIETTQPVQRYAWLGAVPTMREFLDERRLDGLAAYATSIADKTFESTIAVERAALEDDQLGLIRLRVRDLAERVAAHRHQMVVEALVGGDSGAGYDGRPLLAPDHPVGAATRSNTSPEPLAASSLKDAISSMMGVPDDTGVPLGISPDVLLVGPENYWTALELVEASSTGAGGTFAANVLQGRLRVVASPFIRGGRALRWFVLDTSRAMRGIILQLRSDVPIEFTALDSTSGSESAFLRDRFAYGVRARYNVGYGLWQTVFGGRPDVA